MAANLWLSSNQTLSRFKFPGACQVRAEWQVQSGISEQVTEAFYNTLLGKATWHCSSALPITSILPVSFSLLISLLSQTKFTHSSVAAIAISWPLDHQDFELTPPRPELSHTSTSCRIPQVTTSSCCSFSDGVYDILWSSAQDSMIICPERAIVWAVELQLRTARNLWLKVVTCSHISHTTSKIVAVASPVGWAHNRFQMASRYKISERFRLGVSGSTMGANLWFSVP